MSASIENPTNFSRRSVKHDTMMPISKIFTHYTDGFTVGLEPEKIKLKIDLVQKRHQNAIDKVRQFESDLKRKTNLLKKWQKKVKYYEKRGVENANQSKY